MSQSVFDRIYGMQSEQMVSASAFILTCRESLGCLFVLAMLAVPVAFIFTFRDKNQGDRGHQPSDYAGGRVRNAGVALAYRACRHRPVFSAN